MLWLSFILQAILQDKVAFEKKRYNAEISIKIKTCKAVNQRRSRLTPGIIIGLHHPQLLHLPPLPDTAIMECQSDKGMDVLSTRSPVDTRRWKAAMV